MRTVTLMVACLLVSGCLAGPILLRDGKGEIAKCEASSMNLLVGGYLGSKHQVEQCASAYEQAGYHRVN